MQNIFTSISKAEEINHEILKPDKAVKVTGKGSDT
jgi:hypothetical protein